MIKSSEDFHLTPYRRLITLYFLLRDHFKGNFFRDPRPSILVLSTIPPTPERNDTYD